MPSFYEFFAGGGMARAGLGAGWTCLFANDFDPKKGAAYARNWGHDHLVIGDVAKVTTSELPGVADMAWASFPCQDLSLAGAGAGLKGERSGTFWPFWELMLEAANEGRAPSVVTLENVCGALTSHDGRDFATIGEALAEAGYLFGAVVVDAVHFVPQSRPRLFIVAVMKTLQLPAGVVSSSPDPMWHPAALVATHHKLSKSAKDAWVWWNLPAPPVRSTSFVDLVEEAPQNVVWHTEEQTQRLLSMMSPLHAERVDNAVRAGRRVVGTIYRRTRPNGPDGKKVQRAEIRIDDVAGCLRTPSGGSSRQMIMVIEGKRIRSRLLSPREAARLMGLPDSYELPENYNDAYHLLGDGLVVPAVRFLAENLIEPLVSPAVSRRAA